MGIYAAISGAQLVMLQINFTCVVTFGIRAGRWGRGFQGLRIGVEEFGACEEVVAGFGCGCGLG
jgi:hypothetical protein